MDMKEIGNRIRGRRELLGYTREVLAEKINVTPKFCSDIELGVKGMSLNTLCNISRALKIDTDYILFGNENTNNFISLINMLNTCKPEKIKYIEDIIRILTIAID